MLTCLDFKATAADLSWHGKVGLAGDEQTSPRFSSIPREPPRSSARSPRQGWGCGDGHVRALPFPALPNKHFIAAAGTSNSLGAGKHLAARPKRARPLRGLTAGSLPLKFYVQKWFPLSP